jgi:alanine racemase
MDMCMVDITDIHAEEGDEVVIFGNDYPITNIARQLGTIPYEVLTSVSRRVKRVYYQE